jgi:hypothetical protein
VSERTTALVELVAAAMLTLSGTAWLLGLLWWELTQEPSSPGDLPTFMLVWGEVPGLALVAIGLGGLASQSRLNRPRG